MEKSFDWNLARAFLAAAETGSFSAAARSLNLTQPTLGRQVAALEQALSVTLFQRTGRELVLTRAGLDLLEHVRAMGDAADRVALVATGQAQAIEGQVTISATDMMAAWYLPMILVELQKVAPGITIEIVASNALSDLQRREADIAIRHVRPSQPDLIARLVGETTAHLYAAPSYLKRYGKPQSVADLADAPFVGFGDPDRMLGYLTAVGLPISRGNIRWFSEDGVAAWELVRHGLGVAMMTRNTAQATGGVEQILPDFPAVPVPIWLVTHRELQTSRRIRVVFDLLARTLASQG